MRASTTLKAIMRSLEKKGFIDDGSIDLYTNMNGDPVLVICPPYYRKENKREYNSFMKYCDALDGLVLTDEDNAVITYMYSDETYIDYEDYAYYGARCYSENYGEQDVIFLDCDIVGRARIENDEVDFEDLVDYFIDEDSRALPTWFPTDELEALGFEQKSCDFANGWYGRVDNPSKIIDSIKEKYPNAEVVFQIDYAHMFEVGFCVWVKANEDLGVA